MSTYRIGMVVTLLLLGACSMEPARHQPARIPQKLKTPASMPAAPATIVAPVAAPVAVSVAAPASTAIPTPAAPPPTVANVPVVEAKPSWRVSNQRAPSKPVLPKVVAPAAVEPATLQINGHVTLTGVHGQHVVAGDLSDTLVYFVPADGDSRAKPGHYTVYTHNRDFSPEALAIPQGSTVTFVNLDDVRHNVFSVTPGSTFDLGYQSAGDKASHVFTHAGLVLVSCHVHRSMELDMLVVPTRYAGKVAADGSFTLRGLPAGAGTLHFWNPRAQPVGRMVTLPMKGALAESLQANRPRMTTQLNIGISP